MQEISYPLTNYVEIGQLACEQLNGIPTTDGYRLNGAKGKANVECFDYGFFSVMLSQCELEESVKVSRSKSQLEGYLAFDFLLRGYSDAFSNRINQQINQFSFGCYISTPCTASFCIYRPKTNYQLLSVLIEANWLESFLGKELPALLQKPNEPLFIHLPLEISLITSLKSLFSGKEKKVPRKPMIYAKSLEALTSALTPLWGENLHYSQHSFTPEELEIVSHLSEWFSTQSEPVPSVDKLAARFGLNKNKLQSLFKSVYGQTVADYIRHLKMQNAYELLLQNHSVSEVGHSLGYSNLSHFSKAFKKAFGLNPSQVRKNSSR